MGQRSLPPSSPVRKKSISTKLIERLQVTTSSVILCGKLQLRSCHTFLLTSHGNQTSCRRSIVAQKVPLSMAEQSDWLSQNQTLPSVRREQRLNSVRIQRPSYIPYGCNIRGFKFSFLEGKSLIWKLSWYLFSLHALRCTITC